MIHVPWRCPRAGEEEVHEGAEWSGEVARMQIQVKKKVFEGLGRRVKEKNDGGQISQCGLATTCIAAGSVFPQSLVSPPTMALSPALHCWNIRGPGLISLLGKLGAGPCSPQQSLRHNESTVNIY